MSLSTAQKLVEAQDALHKLQTGQAVRVFVDQNGERVEFNMTTVARLLAYIASLENQIGGVPSTGSIGFIF
jgi:hypothetical protein